MIDRLEGSRSGGPLGIDRELQQLMEKKREQDQEMVVHMPHFAFDQFERHLADANGAAATGDHAGARVALDKAFEYAKEVRDDRLEKDLLIRLEDAQRRLLRA